MREPTPEEVEAWELDEVPRHLWPWVVALRDADAALCEAFWGEGYGLREVVQLAAAMMREARDA